MVFLKLYIGFFEILNLYSNFKKIYFEIIINSQEIANIVKDVGLIWGFFHSSNKKFQFIEYLFSSFNVKGRILSPL